MERDLDIPDGKEENDESRISYCRIGGKNNG